MIQVIMSLIVIGVLLMLANVYLPMDEKIRSILNAAVVIAVILYLLNAFGILPLGDMPVPQVR